MKYSTLTNQFAKWLFDLIDRRDCGYMHADGRPRAMHSNRVLGYRDSDYPPRSITRTDLEQHLLGQETLYYRSRHASGYVLAMIDIDAHEGQQDAQAVADWIVGRYFEGAYVEPSTHGLGRHAYCLFRVGNESRDVVNKALHEASKALSRLVENEGFKSKLCGIYGTYTLWRRDDDGSLEIDKRGLLAKVPRLPSGMASLEHLVYAPVFFPLCLRNIIQDAKQVNSSSDVMADTGIELPQTPRCVLLINYTNTSTSESSDQQTCIERLIRAKSMKGPMVRMRMASSIFYEEYGRYAGVDELVAYYEQHGLNTGADKLGKRIERAKIAIDRHKATQSHRVTRKYRQGDYLPMIDKNVTQVVVMQPVLKYRYRIGHDLLAAALYAYTRAAFARNRPDRMHSLSDAGLVRMLEKLAATGDVTSKYGDKEKRVAIRQILQLAGLIVLRDGEHVHAGRHHGIGDRWGLGPNHARYREFVDRYGDVVDPRSLPAVSPMASAHIMRTA